MVAGLRFAGVHDYNNYLQVISEVSELYDKPFLDIFEISRFSGQMGLIGGEPNFFYWNLPVCVTWEPMQKFVFL